MPDEEIARLLGLSKQAFTEALSLLLRKKVTERNEYGALVNRRMVRERLKAEARSRAGTAGANARWRCEADGKKIAEPWHHPDIEIEIANAFSLEGTEAVTRFKKHWEEWVTHRVRYGEHPKDWRMMLLKQIQFLSQFKVDGAIESINASIRGNWRGLFEPKRSPSNGHSMSIMDLRAVIQAKEVRAASLRAKHSSQTAMDTIWNSTEARREYFKLKKEIEGLQRRIESYAAH